MITTGNGTERGTKMSAKNNNRLWAVSLIAIGVAALLLLGMRLAAGSVPDLALRVLGAIELLALPVLAFTTVRKLTRKN